MTFFLAHLSLAHADAIKDALNQKYKKQVLALRTPFAHGDMKFDSGGQPLHARPEGTWLTYGGIYVEKLNVSKDALWLEGRRVAISDQKKKGKTVIILMGRSLKIEVRLDQPLQSADEAQFLLGRIFYLDAAEALGHAKPELRRSDGISSSPIYHPGNDDVKAPRATYTPEPEFSEEARRAKFQGIVVLSIIVDETGHISRVRLERPLGQGLDENAMEGVKTWRFDPAKRNGQPVAMEMRIEVSFNLY